ncbi:MAG: hypothetical protein L6Q99_22240 [Planctomycetes bacterium]|nr:hypothetical protein [Planctomycetota bacterium]
MNRYHIWCNLKRSHDDLAFAAAAREYLDALKSDGRLVGWSLTRRKLGFGPATLGEFHMTLDFATLADLDATFGAVARRAGDVERLHARVYSLVTDFQAALYRDFPDPERATGSDGRAERHG